MKIKFTEYLHGEYESYDEYPPEVYAAREHFSERDFDNFRGTFYEVSVDCEVDTETGQVTVFAFDGHELKEPELRQVGWLGHSGTWYPIHVPEKQIMKTEQTGYSPVYIKEEA